MQNSMMTMMLAMMAASKTHEELANECFNALEKFKASDFKDEEAENDVFQSFTTMLLKCTQKGQTKPEDIAKQALRLAKTAQNLKDLEDLQNKSKIVDDNDDDDELQGPIIMGAGGMA